MPGKQLTITTQDGQAPARLFGEPGRPGVVLYMDIFGPRPAIWEMAERMAGMGVMVLVPDLLYRFGDYGPIDAKTGFAQPESAQLLRKMIAETSRFVVARDSAAYLEALDAEGAVGKIATVGYCFGGGHALSAAAAHADRVALAASFHGGNLAVDSDDSPHLFVSEIEGMVYVASASDDRSFPPEQAALLAEELAEADVAHVIEHYKGMKHGWCVPDHSVFDPAGAERHWARLATLFAENLT